MAEFHDGVASRRDLRAAGVTRADVRTEISAGRWSHLGRHTVGITKHELEGVARWWWAVWESGAGAVLDGASALCAGGLRGFEPVRIDVSMPHANRRRLLDGVVAHRRAAVPRPVGAGVPRVPVESAALNGACWARTDREAALILCMVIQQRLTTPQRLLAAWRSGVFRSTRRPFLRAAVVDICDGAHSLGELDFTGMCREVGLPPPSRQVLRRGEKGRIYLDAAWEDIGLVVEIDGGHHQWSLNPIEDALRQNDVVIGGDVVLRLPVLGLRLERQRFMGQVLAAHRRLTAAGAA